MTGKIAATIITGFLGSGKTTLIRNLIENANGAKLALIVNEFGDMGFDGGIFAACNNPNCTEEDVIELTNGCICCTVADDFQPAITRILEREERPDHIIIETSGLALPQPLVQAFNWPGIKENVSVDGVISVVDGPAVRDGLFASNPDDVDQQRSADEALDHAASLRELFEDQIKCADLIVISKSDKMDSYQSGFVRMIIKDHQRDDVKIINSTLKGLAPEILLGIDANAQDDIHDREGHHHHHHHAEGHDHHHHDHHHHHHDHDDFKSIIIKTPQFKDKSEAHAFVELILQRKGILRVKGKVAIENAVAPYIIQAVGKRLDSYFDKPSIANPSQLVVIGMHNADFSIPSA